MESKKGKRGGRTSSSLTGSRASDTRSGFGGGGEGSGRGPLSSNDGSGGVLSAPTIAAVTVLSAPTALEATVVAAPATAEVALRGKGGD